MMNRFWLIFWWCLAIASALIMVLYVFKHDFYGVSDNIWEYYGVLSTYHSLWHQDAKLLARPGYLFNIPFVMLGLNLYGLKIVCFFLELLSFLSFLWAYKPRVFNQAWLPMALLLFLSVYAMRFQVILNYYSASLVFLQFGLAAYFLQRRQGSFWWSGLAGFCLAIAAFSNFAMVPIYILAMAAFLVVYRRKAEFFMALAFGVALCLILFLYLIPFHAAQLYHQTILTSGSTGQLQVMIAVSLFMLLTLVVLSVIPLLAMQFFSKGLSQKFLLVWALLLFAFFCGNQFSGINLEYFSGFLSTPFILAFLLTLLMFLWSRLSAISREEIFLICLFVGGILFWNRGISHANEVVYLYLPIMFTSFLLVFPPPKKSWQHAACFFVLAAYMVMPIKMVFFEFMHPFPISVNQVNTSDGIYADRYTYQVDQKIRASYQKYHCAHKPFLAFYDLTRAYLITGRHALFDVGFIPSEHFPLQSRRINNKDLIQFFSSHKSWCVAYQPPVWSDFKLGVLTGFHRWLVEHSTHQVFMGYRSYQLTAVWFFVK